VDRTQKAELVTTMGEVFAKTELVVVTRYSGLTVQEITDLRRQMRAAGASFKVTKNRITRLALEGTRFKPLADLFKGPTAIAYSDDPIAAAKVATDYAKKNEKLVVLGGATGDTVLNPQGVTALASLPSLNELRGKIVGLIQAPATKIAGVLQAPAGQLARLVGAYASKGQAA
jgi:large subunit ribosomal protein L10